MIGLIINLLVILVSLYLLVWLLIDVATKRAAR